MIHTDFGTWTREQLGCRVQKLAVDGGFTCPNRDGRLSTGGCTFCRNEAFSPAYCRETDSVAKQLEAGKRFFARKYKSEQTAYLAYFQAYSGTYAPVGRLRRLYEEALAVPGVVGLVVATRPDCVTDETLNLLEELNRRTFLIVEYGIESVSDETLRRVHRGHTFGQAEEAVRRTAERGIRVGAHMILGFPWERHEELMRQAGVLARLPLTTLKLHQLQIVRGTELAREFERSPWRVWSAEEYIDTVLDYTERLPKEWVLERLISQSPRHLVVAPGWGLKAGEFEEMLEQRRTIRTGWPHSFCI